MHGVEEFSQVNKKEEQPTSPEVSEVESRLKKRWGKVLKNTVLAGIMTLNVASVLDSDVKEKNT